jgi:predicted nucleic acid-binding Zn ribbon protein
MGIKPFLFSLLIISASLLVATIVFTPIKQVNIQNLPDVTFINSIMYDVDNKEVTQIVKSKKAYHYKNKEEIYDATVVLKLKENNITTSDTVNAKFIKVTQEFLKFRGDVHYSRTTGTTLESEELDYNRISKHLVGDQKFEAYYKGNKLKGNSLSIKKDETVFESTDNTPVKLDIIMD